MSTRSNSDTPGEVTDGSHAPLPNAPLTAGRRITLTETCDFVPLDTSGDAVAQRRFGLLVRP